MIAGVIFVSSGYFYLNHELEKTEKSESTIPYYSQAPENAGVLFDILDNRILFYLDFENNSINVFKDYKNTSTGEMLNGFRVDYVIKGDYDLLSYIIDCIGGIELETEKETLRFTGVQVIEKIKDYIDSGEIYQKIIPAILEKIKQNGIGREDFIYIIENSETNLTLPDCYYWSDYIKSLYTININ